MPPTELSSSAAPDPSAWLAVAGGGRRRAARSNGLNRHSGPSREDRFAACVRLLEGLVGRTEMADCAQHALRWLGDALDVSQSLCLVKRAAEQLLVTVAAVGFKPSPGAVLSISFEAWGDPLLNALTHRRPIYYGPNHGAAERRRRPTTPFGAAPFTVVP